MKDPRLALQAGVWAALTSSAAVKALIGNPARVYDKVVKDPTYPFVRIGDDQVLNDSNGCADAWEAFVTVHIFSRDTKAPRPQVRAISNAVVGVLDNTGAPLTLAGFTIELSDFQEARDWEEEDGLTVHGIARVRYLIADT